MFFAGMCEGKSTGYVGIGERAELYACVYVKNCPMQTMLRLCPRLHDVPTILLDGEPSNQQVHSLNSKAALIGLRAEMTRAETELFPKHVALLRCTAAEMSTHALVLECAGFYSPRVEVIAREQEFVCVIDIAGTGRLYGTPEMLAEGLVRQLHALNICARVAVSGNFYTSIYVAKGMTKDTWHVVPSGAERMYLSSLPWTVLELTPAQREALELWGVSTIGEFTGLSQMELASRMGCEDDRLYRLATGTLSHHFQPLDFLFALEERLELEAPIELLDSLCFAVDVVMERLIERARGQCVALAKIEVSFFSSNCETQVRFVRTMRPSLDKHLWLKLLRLSLSAEPLTDAVIAVEMRAEPGNATMVQFGLYSTQLPESGQLDLMLGRVRAVVGEESAGRAVLQDAHRYGMARIEPFTLDEQGLSGPELLLRNGAMCCSQFAKGFHVISQEGRPVIVYLSGQKFVVEHSCGPWNTSGAWWTRSPWLVDQWDVVARGTNGVMLACCILHDLLGDEWHIRGFYD